jgi:phosphoribosylformylglycinamidine synthase
MTLDFKNEGDLLYLIGISRNDLGSSEYVRSVLGIEYSSCPWFDLEEEFRIQQVIKDLISLKLVSSVHDVSEGGVFANLVESAMPRGLGFSVNTNPAVRKDAWLFGEAQSRVVVSISAEQHDTFSRYLSGQDVPFEAIGKAGGSSVVIDGENWGSVSEWSTIHQSVLGNWMNQ